uniref:Uncharacterized protein n=1 Tax=Trichogramma kaykai TaxID=54128 RepID=A0ABD2X073_9HYME
MTLRSASTPKRPKSSFTDDRPTSLIDSLTIIGDVQCNDLGDTFIIKFDCLRTIVRMQSYTSSKDEELLARSLSMVAPPTEHTRKVLPPSWI